MGCEGMSVLSPMSQLACRGWTFWPRPAWVEIHRLQCHWYTHKRRAFVPFFFFASAPLRHCKVVTGFFFHFQSLLQKLWIMNVTFIVVIWVVIDILQYWKVIFFCLFSCSTEIITVITDTNPFLSFLFRMLFWPCMLLQPLWILIYICNTSKVSSNELATGWKHICISAALYNQLILGFSSSKSIIDHNSVLWSSWEMEM